MKNKLAIAFLGFCGVLFAQTDIEIVQLHKPAGATYPYSQVEPSIAIDPSNPSIMAAGSVLSDYYYSTDSGKTWTSKTLTSKYGVYGDPVLTFDTKGKLYFFHLAHYSKSTDLDRIVCQRAGKVDGKFTKGSFPKPSGTKVQDKHWVIVNPKNNDIYMTWTQFDVYDSADPKDSSIIVFSKSTNDGRSWSLPLRISKFGGDCVDSDETVEGAVPAIGPNGEIYVTWTGPKGLVMQKSMDEGKTWLPEERIIQEHVGGWDLTIPGVYRANGLPILKCDLSNGPNRGTLYLNWCDQKMGEDDTDVWIMKSTDGGETWSERIKVNQDAPGKHQFFTWMDVDQSTGNLYFVYYDRRDQTGIETDVYVSASKDGGETFVDTKISKTPFIPNKTKFFGDYLNIAAVNGVVRPIWPRYDDGKITLWVALLNEQMLLK